MAADSLAMPSEAPQVLPSGTLPKPRELAPPRWTRLWTKSGSMPRGTGDSSSYRSRRSRRPSSLDDAPGAPASKCTGQCPMGSPLLALRGSKGIRFDMAASGMGCGACGEEQAPAVPQGSKKASSARL